MTSRRMRDMARRRMDMARRRRDYARGRRDYRNPYGSEGGYVVSRRTGRDMLMMDDMRRYRENPEMMDGRNYDYVPTYNGNPVESDGHYPYMMDFRGDYRRDYRGDRRDYRGDYRRDYRDYRDYGSGEEYLSEDELMDWCEDLMDEVEPKDKAFFSKENVKKRAETMNIKFDEFTPEEFHVTVLMMYTDYKEPLGTTNLDVYLPLAKAWLMDKDSDLQGGEKLAAYYYNVVCADEE